MKQLPTLGTLLLALAAGATAHGAATPEAEPVTAPQAFTASTRYSVTGHSRLRAGSPRQGDLATDEFEAKVGGTYTLGATDSIGAGLGWGRIGFDFDPTAATTTPQAAALPDRVQSLALDLSWRHAVNDRWISLVAVSPGLRWADSNATSDAFGLTGVVGTLYRRSDTLTWMFGVAFDSLSHDLPVLPAIGLEWHPASTWTVAVGFPNTSVAYHVSPALTLAAVLDGQGGTYHVRRDPAPGGRRDDSKFEYWDARGGLQATYRFCPACALTATVGSVFFGEGEYHESGVPDAKFKSDRPTLYGSAGLELSF